jgi:hypothetical protein
MNHEEFYGRFPDEDACKQLFKEYRDRVGVSCYTCGGTAHYWMQRCWSYKCKKCKSTITLKSGTVLQNSKLKYKTWFIAMNMMTSMKKDISALEMQRQLRHKFYEPIWYMMHKIRVAMGKRDSRYSLEGFIEMDEAYFETHSFVRTRVKEQSGTLKRGRGSQRQSPVLVMAQYEPNKSNEDENRPNSALKYVRMIALDDTTRQTIMREVEQIAEKQTHFTTDANPVYHNLNETYLSHKRIVSKNESSKKKVLPWAHTIISNAKRGFLGVHHAMNNRYLQNYLNEFCFKLNRRYFGEALFERILNTSVSMRWNVG